LYFTFFKIGAVTFGGGLAMLPILERTLIDKLHWTTKEDLMDYYAIGQVTPGIIAVNVATFIGFNKQGILGGIVATAGVVSPSVIIITVIAFFLETFSEIIWVQKALKGINVAVAALLTSILWKFIKCATKYWNKIIGFILVVISFVLLVFLKLPSPIVIIGGAIFGIITYVISSSKSMKIKENEK
jgi:chromate transporter